MRRRELTACCACVTAGTGDSSRGCLLMGLRRMRRLGRRRGSGFWRRLARQFVNDSVIGPGIGKRFDPLRDVPILHGILIAKLVNILFSRMSESGDRRRQSVLQEKALVG